MREFIYARVSTEDQVAANQVEILKKKYPNAEVFTDIASGAKEKENLIKLMAGWKKGDKVYVYKLDRISRNAAELMQIMAIAEKNGVEIKSETQTIGDDPSGKLLATILAGVSEFERALIVERTKAGLRRAKREGKELGGKREGAGRKPKELSKDEIMFIHSKREKLLSWEDTQALFVNKFNREISASTLRRKYDSR